MSQHALNRVGPIGSASTSEVDIFAMDQSCAPHPVAEMFFEADAGSV
jgi:hypothetical protein